jgi:hypothetical protein
VKDVSANALGTRLPSRLKPPDLFGQLIQGIVNFSSVSPTLGPGIAKGLARSRGAHSPELLILDPWWASYCMAQVSRQKMTG